jgi:hypothetical protein
MLPVLGLGPQGGVRVASSLAESRLSLAIETLPSRICRFVGLAQLGEQRLLDFAILRRHGV